MVLALDANEDSHGTYYYDGDGKRVKKVVTGGETTVFVYDASGKMIGEYSTQLNQTPQVSYLTSDVLGSPRINTDENGAVISRHDYHPFGEEIIGSGGRTQGLGYQSDEIRKQFTGYERDDETGLDFAQARMYASNLGRFISPDDFLNDTHLVQPASWNLYTYAANNPLRFTDPTGESIWIRGLETYETVDDDGDKVTRTRPVEVEYKNGKLYSKDGSAYTGNSEYVKK